MDIVIRPMTKEDTIAVSELEKECFKVPWSKESLDNELKNKMAHYFVATKDNSVVGYIGMWVVLDETQIMNVAVTEQYRGMGIATALVCKACEVAKEHLSLSISLEVRVSNEKAIKLYEKNGFRHISIRKGYYRDNREDALIMMKGICGTGEI